MIPHNENGSARPGYIPAIDGLRAVAILSVLIFHVVPAWLPGGFTGVDIFFVISGFVVTGSMLGRSFGSLGGLARYFYARRLLRIMPALLVTLLATFVATQLFIPEAWLSTSVTQTGIAAIFGLSNIVLGTASDTYFGPQAAYNPFTHTWSLGVEEQFYLAFPFILHWHQKRHGQELSAAPVIRLVAGLTLGSLATAAVLGAIDGKLAFYLIFSRFWELGAGMLLCLTVARWRPALTAAGAGWQRVLALAGAALIAAGFALPESAWFPFPLGLLPVLGTTALIALVVVAPTSLTARLLATRLAVGIGLISYSLYLWHWPVVVLLRWTVGLDTAGQMLAAVALSFLLAILSFMLVEHPLRVSAKLGAFMRRRVVLAGLAATLATTAVALLLVAARDRITLSRTGDRLDWYAENGRPLDPARTHCDVREQFLGIGGGKVTVWTPETCKVQPAGFTLYAPGDSHTLAYAPNYRQLAADLGIEVRQYFRAGCPWLKLKEPVNHRKCDRFFGAIEGEMRAKLRPGDVVFAPGLRLSRLTNQFPGDRDVDHPTPDTVSAGNLAAGRTTLAPLVATGAAVVIEAPKPILPAPPFRCSDWFNRGNAFCRGGLSMPRAAMEQRRAAMLGAIEALAAATARTRVWDPLPLLCSETRCDAVDAAGRPLFFDGDHLSGHGNDTVYPGLRAAVLEAHRR